MKVHIGKYKNWIGPYQIAQVLCFWAKDDIINGYPDYVHNFGTWLAEDKNGNDSWLTKICQWIDSKRKRKVKIKIDPWDTWNTDHTLALIALPLLKQLKETNHGAPYTDDFDVPEHLRSYNAKPKEDEWATDEFHHNRWQYVLSEIIWSLEQHVDDKEEDKFYDQSEVKRPDDLIEQTRNIKVDSEGLEMHHKRKQKGFELLGKYWQCMWD